MTAAVPVIIALIVIISLIKRVDILEVFCQGARENLITAFELCPALILLVTAVDMLSASGAAQALSSAAAPIASSLGFPSECVPLMLMRPVSGSGSIAVLKDIFSKYGADSFAGMCASVMMSATETTLYTIAVYYSAVKAKPKTGVFISSFTADVSGFLFASLFVKLMLFS